MYPANFFYSPIDLKQIILDKQHTIVHLISACFGPNYSCAMRQRHQINKVSP